MRKIACHHSNKPGKAEVGAISKAQNSKGHQSIKYFLQQYPNEEKNFQFFFEYFLKSPLSRIVPKKVKGGPFGIF